MDIIIIMLKLSYFKGEIFSFNKLTELYKVILAVNVFIIAAYAGGKHSHCTVGKGYLGQSQERHGEEWSLPHSLT